MAQNDKGKGLYTGLRKEDCSKEHRLGAKKEKKEAADNMLPKFDDLETRITKLEALFNYLKERKERKEKKELKENGDRESCGFS